jgi:hypothetical protein
MLHLCLKFIKIKMKLLKLIIVLIITQTQFVLAQEVQINWSIKQNETGGESGYLLQYLDANNENVYALFTKSDISEKINDKKIVAFNKSTMEKKASVKFEDIISNKELYSKLELLKIVIQNDGVYIFWTKVEKQLEELYVEKLDNNLKKVVVLKKIKSCTVPSEFKRAIYAKNRTSFDVLVNKKELLIGYEKHKLEGFINFSYENFNIEDGLSNEKEIDLPTKSYSKYLGLTSIYQLLEDGNIVVKSFIKDPNSDYKPMPGIKLTKGWYSNIFSFINTTSNKLVSININERDIYLTDLNKIGVKYISTEKKVIIFGLYLDTNTTSKNQIDGFEFIEIDKITLDVSEINKINFDSPTLNNLHDIINIDNVYSINNNVYISITSTEISFNPSGAPGSNYLKKGDIFLIKINGNGELSWTSKINREKYYGPTFGDFSDIRVLSFENNIGLFYVSKEIKRNSLLNQKIEGIQNNINYSFVDINTGKIETKEIYFSADTRSEDKMNFMPNSKVIDNILYTYPYEVGKIINRGCFGAIFLK